MIFTLFYCVLMISVHFYKGYGGLVYPPVIWGMEFSGLLCLCVVQIIRILYSFYANRLENAFAALMSFILTFLSFLVIMNFTFLGTYVLTIEVLTGIVVMILSLLEMILSLYAWKKFKAN